jgi:ATP-dependent DNA helicase RecG
MQYKTNIKKLIQAGESDTIEFKLSFSDEVIETVVAFSNTSGGSVFIGIDDNGKFVGVKVGQETVQNWLNTIKNKTVPSLIPDIIDRVINGKTVYEIRVNFLAILLLKSLVLIHINRICETN